MQSKQVRAFKNELRNFGFLLQEITRLENEIEELYDQLGGVRGVDPSREPLHTMPNKEMEYQLRDSISKLDAKLSLRRKEKERVESVMALIEKSLSDAIFSIYVLGEKTEDVAKRMYYSANGLHSRINKAIERALDEE